MPRTPNSKKQQSNTPSDDHIARPPNCFILFRADYSRSITESASEVSGRQQQKDVSLEAAAAWKELPPEEQEHYRKKAEEAKEAHARMHPGWVYKPGQKTQRKKAKVVEDDDPPVKCVPRNCKTTPRKKSPMNADGRRRMASTPSNQDTAPIELVWDSSWFSGTAPMTDPFYSAPFQPLASTSAVPSPVVPVLPVPFFSMDHAHGFDMTRNSYPVQSMYDPNASSENGVPDSSGGHDQHPPNQGGDLPAPFGPPATEVPTSYSDAEPPTHALLQNPDLPRDELLESFYYNDGWGVDPAFAPGFDSFFMTEL